MVGGALVQLSGPRGRTRLRLRGTVPRNRMRRVAHYEAKKTAKNLIDRSIETKMFDGQFPQADITFSGFIYSLYSDPNAGFALIARGTSNNQYLGDTITPTHVKLRGLWRTGDNDNMMRVIIVQWRGITTGITAATVLQSVGNVRTPLSDFDKDEMHRFKVLSDKLYHLNDSMSTTQSFTINISRKKLSKTQFNTVTGAVSNGDILVAMYSDSAIATHPQMELYHRIKYKDA